jgi:hypothetical protein
MRKLIFLLALLLPSAALSQPGHGPISGGGSGGGVAGLTTANGGTAIGDNQIIRGDGTTGIQGSALTVADTTGNIQGPAAGFTLFGGTSTTADLTFQVTTGSGTTGSDMHFLVGNNGAVEALKLTDTGHAQFDDGSSTAPAITMGTAGVGFYRDGTTGANAFGFTASTPSFKLQQAEIQFVGNGLISWGNQVNTFATSSTDLAVKRDAVSIMVITDASSGGAALKLRAIAAPLRACDATGAGDIYRDTSLALCFCDGTSWQVLNPSTVGVGTCS